MAKRLLIVCAVIFLGIGLFGIESAPAQTEPGAHPTTTDQQAPPARLIKRKPGHTEAHPVEHPKRPLDDRCKPLKDQLELELQKAGTQRRVFQARLAHNAGTRFCREGAADKGIAEFQRGLSYLQVPH